MKNLFPYFFFDVMIEVFSASLSLADLVSQHTFLLLPVVNLKFTSKGRLYDLSPLGFIKRLTQKSTIFSSFFLTVEKAANITVISTNLAPKIKTDLNKEKIGSKI